MLTILLITWRWERGEERPKEVISYLHTEAMELVRNIDWLSFSVKLAAPIPDDYRLLAPDGYNVQEFKGTQQYRRRFIVSDGGGAKLLTILASPYSSIIRDDLALVEVANPLLYDESWFTIIQNVLQRMLPCQFNNMHRLDLCADFECTDTIADTLQDMCDNRVYVQGKRASVIFTDLVAKSSFVTRDLTQISWGSHQSHMRFKVYNKFKELSSRVDGKLVYDKPYIVDQWLSAGMHPEQVWRWEVSLTEIGSREFFGAPITIDELCNRDYWLYLQKELYGHYFILRENAGNSNKSRNPIRPFLELPTVDGKKTYTRRVTEGRKTNFSAITALNRLMADYVSVPIAMSDVSDDYRVTIVNLVAKCRLGAYF